MTLADDRLRVESGLAKLNDLEEVILDCLATLHRRRSTLVAAHRSQEPQAPCGTADAKLIRRTAELIKTAQQGQKTLLGLVIEIDLDPDSNDTTADEMRAQLTDCRIRLQAYLLSLVRQARVLGEMSLEHGLGVLTKAQGESRDDPSSERLRKQVAGLVRRENISRQTEAGGSDA